MSIALTALSIIIVSLIQRVYRPPKCPYDPPVHEDDGALAIVGTVDTLGDGSLFTHNDEEYTFLWPVEHPMRAHLFREARLQIQKHFCEYK